MTEAHLMPETPTQPTQDDVNIGGLISEGEEVGQTPALTLRVIALSVLLAGIFGYLIPIIDFKLNNTSLGGAHLPVGAVGVLLFVLLGLNPLLRLLARGLAFSRNESL